MKHKFSSENLTIHVNAPARLHLGFLDLHGGLGRHFGSIGLSIKEIATEISAIRTRDVTVTGPCADRAQSCAEKLIATLDIDGGANIVVNQAIPEHAGLGSGTQMSLAVGMAITRLYDLDLSISQISAILERGNRSGIGIGAFLYGGFILDGGRAPSSLVPPVISHLDIPEAWRFILVMDRDREGLNGPLEKDVFTRLGTVKQQTSAEICRLVLMQVLPAIVEQDCGQFGVGITKIQEYVGEYFAEVQGGLFCSPEVEKTVRLLQVFGATGIGQTSWGPTGFAIFADETSAIHALKQVRVKLGHIDGLEYVISSCRNSTADILVGHTGMEKIRIRH